jgi:hypothetical protein
MRRCGQGPDREGRNAPRRGLTRRQKEGRRPKVPPEFREEMNMKCSIGKPVAAPHKIDTGA